MIKKLANAVALIITIDIAIMAVYAIMKYREADFFGAHFIFLLITIIVSLIFSICAFVTKRKWVGILWLINLFLGTLSVDIFAFWIRDVFHRNQVIEYVFDDQEGGHFISIDKNTLECEISDYESSDTYEVYSNCRYGKCDGVSTPRINIYLNGGVTLSISNDTLYGFSPSPIRLKQK